MSTKKRHTETYSVKKVLKGASMYSLGDVLVKASGFFLIPLYTRVLTPADYGIVGYLQVDRKSTRLNSSHVRISYAVFCLKKKKYMNTLPLFSQFNTLTTTLLILITALPLTNSSHITTSSSFRSSAPYSFLLIQSHLPLRL